ncbi:MAG: hypothetical protein K2Y14_03115 [Burkholderiales bacterium]|nr:hypothetical protein [Burkholderiales bacterium]
MSLLTNKNYKTFAMVKYLSDNYYIIEELASKANMSVTKIKQLLEFNLIPNYTYRICCSISESSVLLGTLFAEDEDIDLYHKSTLSWIEKAKVALIARNNNFLEASTYLKDQMKQKYYDLFLTHKLISFGFNDLYDKKQNINANKFEEYFNKIYQAWCNGTYGICNKNPSDELSIFYKEAYQNLLNSLTESNTKTEYLPEEYLQVVNATKQYDHYVSEFTPLSFANSSRHKFIDNMLLLEN